MRGGPIHWSTLWAVIAAAALYGAVHAGLRLSFSPTIPIDDAWENVFSQSLRLGYDTRNPALYTWLLIGVQQIFGVGLTGFLALKYTLWTGSAAFMFLAVRAAAGTARMGAFGTAALTLLYQIGWNAHEGVTQTALLSTAVCGALWAWTRVIRRGGRGDYALLAAFLAVGVLAKLSMFGFIGATVGAALWGGATRARVWNWRMVGVLSAAAGATALVFAGFISLDYAGPGGGAGAGEYLAGLAKGAAHLSLAWIGFLSPLAPLALILRPRGLWRPEGAADTLERWLGRVLIVGAILCLIGLASGFDNFRERYMHPFLLPAVPWLFARLRRAGFDAEDDFDSAARRWFVRAACVAAVVVVIVRAVALLDGGRVLCGKHCRQLTPYAALAAPLTEMGARGATLIADDPYLAGNLRALFPTSRVIWAERADLRPAGVRPRCLVVWSGASPPVGALVPPPTRIRQIAVNWKTLLRPEGFRVSRWRAAELAPETQICQ